MAVANCRFKRNIAIPCTGASQMANQLTGGVRQLNLSSRLDAERDSRLKVLWADGERVFCRTWREADDGKLSPVLAVVSASEHPSLSCLNRLAHEYSLKDALDGPWAVRPLALERERGSSTLVLEDPGGEPLERLLGAPHGAGQLPAPGHRHRRGPRQAPRARPGAQGPEARPRPGELHGRTGPMDALAWRPEFPATGKKGAGHVVHPCRPRSTPKIVMSISEALRDALQVTLSVAPSDATPEQALVDTFARPGYLPDEAKQSALKILAEAEDKLEPAASRDTCGVPLKRRDTSSAGPASIIVSTDPAREASAFAPTKRGARAVRARRS